FRRGYNWCWWLQIRPCFQNSDVKGAGIKDSVTGAKNGFALAPGIPGKADPRAEISVARQQVGIAIALAGVLHLAEEIDLRIHRVGIEVAGPAVAFVGRLLIIVAKAHIDVQVPGDPPVVLNESAQRVALFRFPEIGSTGSAAHGSHEKCRI